MGMLKNLLGSFLLITATQSYFAFADNTFAGSTFAGSTFEDQLKGVAPLGSVFTSTQDALQEQGYVRDGELQVANSTDPARPGITLFSATANFKPGPQISYKMINDALLKPNNCTFCHGAPGSNMGGLNLETYANVKANIVAINQAVISKKVMPPSGPLADADLKLLSAWISAGAPENVPTKPPGANEKVIMVNQGTSQTMGNPPVTTLIIDTVGIQKK